MKIISTLIVSLSALTLSACGFKPMHAPSTFSGKSFDYSSVSVTSEHNEKIDFLLKQSLRDRMGVHQNTAYTLHVIPKLSRGTLGIGGDDVASRYDLSMTVKFELRNAKTGKPVLKDSIRATSTFGAPRDAYGTIAAQDNATEQVTTEAADRIIIRIARYMAGK